MVNSNTGLATSLRGKKKTSSTAVRILRNTKLENEERCGTGSTSGNGYSDGPISIKFTNDYNILQLDRVVMQKFDHEKYEMLVLENELQQLRERRTEPLTLGELRILDSKIEKLSSKIHTLTSGTNRTTYLEKSKPLLERYRSYLTGPQVGKTGYDRERIMTIIDYLELTKDYIEIDYTHVIPSPTVSICRACCQPIDKQMMRDGSDSHCSNCGTTLPICMSGKVMDHNSDIYTKEYSDEKNFIKAFTRYQGQQKLTFKIEDVCAEIDEYLQSEGYKPASYYRSLSPDIYGKKKGTSLEMIDSALDAIKRTHLYESGNLIGKYLWGWVLFDLQHLKDGLISDYRETQGVYDAIPAEEKDRESSLSTQLRLFRLLQLRGHPCRPCDFKLPTQPESLRKQDALWKRMCDTVNRRNPKIYYIPM